MARSGLEPELPVTELQKELCTDRLQHTQNELDLLKSVIVMRLGYLPNLETSDIHCTRSHQTLQEHVSFDDQGHADCFLQYPGCCDGRLGSQWPYRHSTIFN
jgi:hypothetical protein